MAPGVRAQGRGGDSRTPIGDSDPRSLRGSHLGAGGVHDLSLAPTLGSPWCLGSGDFFNEQFHAFSEEGVVDRHFVGEIAVEGGRLHTYTACDFVEIEGRGAFFTHDVAGDLQDSVNHLSAVAFTALGWCEDCHNLFRYMC